MGVNLLGFGASSQRPEKPDSVSRITKNILLTNVWNALDISLLAQHQVTHVVSAMKDEHIPQEVLSGAWFKHGGSIPLPNGQGRYPRPKRIEVPLDDSPKAPLLSLLERAVDFIRGAVANSENAVILVHCFQGVSRSSSVVLAYLMDAEEMTLEEAMKMVKAKRPIIKPNAGFLQQLANWQAGREERQRRKGGGIEEVAQILPLQMVGDSASSESSSVRVGQA